PNHPNLWAATAFGGHGLNTTAMAGAIVARAIAESDDDHGLFAPWQPTWAGGPLGAVAVQASYFAMQMADKREERNDRSRAT
ncbi:MAG: FAD-dependent oxidoreductase, partial [Pseudomonadota bacterium]